MEFFGAIFFLLALMLIKHSQRVDGKMKALQETLVKAATIGERSEEEPCYSYKWVMNYTMKPKRMIAPSGFLPLLVMALTGVIVVTILTIFYSAGYSLLLALIGAAVLLETDVFEAQGYSKAIQKATLDQLNKEDLGYMEIATEALKIGAMRFTVAGVVFAVAGPFIPIIFNSLCYALVLYMSVVFQAAETAQNASKVLAIVVVIILSVTLLYLPELVGRSILIKTKAAIRKLRKQKGE